jgi:hypothetical protein
MYSENQIIVVANVCSESVSTQCHSCSNQQSDWGLRLSLLFFCSCDLAHVVHVAVYGLNRRSSMSTSPFDYLFHTIVACLLLFFKTARLDNVKDHIEPHVWFW